MVPVLNTEWSAFFRIKSDLDSRIKETFISLAALIEGTSKTLKKKIHGAH